MITYLRQGVYIAHSSFSLRNILWLIGGEAYDIFAPFSLFRLCLFLISLIDIHWIEMFGVRLSAI